LAASRRGQRILPHRYAGQAPSYSTMPRHAGSVRLPLLPRTPEKAEPTLLALSAQLRAMASRIIVSADRRDPSSVEGELAELIRRTLELVDRVSAEPPAIDRGDVIDVDAIES